jgi:hypothetical protein
MLKWLRNRWRIIRGYPVTLLLIGLCAGLLAGWFAGSTSLFERVRVSPSKATAYSRLSNQELRSRALELVSRIRDLVRSFDQEDRQLRSDADKRLGETKSPEEQNRIRKSWLDESDKLHAKYMEQYTERFWSEAVLLRDTIVRRLPARSGSQTSQLFLYPTNMLGVGQVANGLELLAKSLPEKEVQ